MTKPARKADEPMLARAEWLLIGWTGLLQAAVTLATFAWALRARDLTEARNLAFTVLVFGELFRAFAHVARRVCSGRSARSRTCASWAIVFLSRVPADRTAPRPVGAVALQDWRPVIAGLPSLPGPRNDSVSTLELTKLLRRVGRRRDDAYDHETTFFHPRRPSRRIWRRMTIHEATDDA